MSTILLALALSSLLKYSNALTNGTECPTGCACLYFSIRSIKIDCSYSFFYGGDAEQLFHQLDSVLSTSQIVEHLTSLSITWTPLTCLPPSICQLLNLTSLTIQQNNNINKLPDSCFTNLTKLVKLCVIGHSIVSLQDGLFDGLRSLTTLDLSFNSIGSLPDGLFDGLRSLTTLDLAGNSIDSLLNGMFDGLQSLTILNLHLNSIGSLQDRSFDGLHSLNILFLSGNSIASLPVGLFDGLQSLVALDLSSNLLSSLQDGLLDGLQILKFLDLSHNSIDSLPNGSFDGLPSLKVLDLSHNSIDSSPNGLFNGLQSLVVLNLRNNSIGSLQDGLFGGLHSLKILDLSHNSIDSLQDGLFNGLQSLTTLYLMNNSIDSLPDGLFGGLHSLKILDLSHNSIDSLQEGLFNGLQSLTTLRLSHNSIGSLPDRLFDGLKSPRTYYMSGNSNDSLPGGFRGGLKSLVTLDLSGNSISSLPDGLFNGLQSLVTLDLSNNLIGSLQDGLFGRIQTLQILDLSRNDISFIGLRVFPDSSDLISLRSLDLSHNKLTSLEPWWYHLCTRGPYTRIILSYNLISHFTNKLQVNTGCVWCPHPSGYLDLSHNLITHMIQIFIGWNITIEEQSARLFGHSNFTLYVAGSKYLCDCLDFPIYKMAKVNPRINILQGVYCTTEYFHRKLGQPVLASSIPLNDFLCERPVGCPSSCRCAYRPENYTLHVDCSAQSAANLSSLPLYLPPLVDMYEQPNHTIKYKLDFSNNKLLTRLGHRSYFFNTPVLDVSNCTLTEITEEDLKDVFRFSVANFRGNMIQSFPEEAKSLNILAQLSLGLNPWKCSCHNSWMIEWLQSLSHQISDPGDIICKSPARMYGKVVVKSTENDFCVDPVQHTLKITLSIVAPIFAIVVSLVITGIAFYKLREKCYKKFKFHPFDRDECIGEDMDYDVFLCCSSLDHRPHALRILELIESNGYRVCYHERDFLPGSLITDNMSQSIEHSKRTVCLISDNFLQSPYCMTEFNFAYHHNVVEKHSKRLIVLMMLDNPTDLYDNDASDMATLRHYLRQYTYIDYTTDDWLDRLLYALPLRGLPDLNDNHNAAHDDDNVQFLEGIPLQ